MSELKPCPLCGNEEPYDDGSYVWCSKESTPCPLSRWPCEYEEWNRRPIEDALASELQQLREKLEEERRAYERAMGEAARQLEEAEKREREANEAIRFAHEMFVQTGTEFSDERVSYESIQIDRGAREEFSALSGVARALAEKEAGGND